MYVPIAILLTVLFGGFRCEKLHSANPEEYPFVIDIDTCITSFASVYIADMCTYCTAAIISKEYVLASSFCMANSRKNNIIKYMTADGNNWTMKRPTKIHTHPCYDIALFEVDWRDGQDLRYFDSKYVKSIDLSERAYVAPVNTTLRLVKVGPRSNDSRLYKDVKIVPTEECTSEMSSSDEEIVCARDKDDATVNEKGLLVYAKENGSPILYAFSADDNGQFWRVGGIVDWIRQTMGIQPKADTICPEPRPPPLPPLPTVLPLNSTSSLEPTTPLSPSTPLQATTAAVTNLSTTTTPTPSRTCTTMKSGQINVPKEINVKILVVMTVMLYLYL